VAAGGRECATRSTFRGHKRQKVNAWLPALRCRRRRRPSGTCNISGAEDIAESGFPMTIIVAAPTAMPARPKSAGDHEESTEARSSQDDPLPPLGKQGEPDPRSHARARQRARAHPRHGLPSCADRAVVASIYFRLLLTREELDEPFLESLTALLAAGAGSRPEKAP
jgi:hypothetical protein